MIQDARPGLDPTGFNEALGDRAPARKDNGLRTGPLHLGMPAKKAATRFSEEERAALKDVSQERKVAWGRDRATDERAVLAKIATLPEPDRSLALRLHSLITAAAPELSPRLWYGMPAYSREGNVLCFFQPASKFKARYATLGFNDAARLDEGRVWPTSFAVKELTPSEEARISALVKKAVN